MIMNKYDIIVSLFLLLNFTLIFIAVLKVKKKEDHRKEWYAVLGILIFVAAFVMANASSWEPDELVSKRLDRNNMLRVVDEINEYCRQHHENLGEDTFAEVIDKANINLDSVHTLQYTKTDEEPSPQKYYFRDGYLISPYFDTKIPIKGK